MGHIRSYSLVDAYARFLRARGDAVLLSIGFDAFGLPAELSAIERGIPVSEWVARCSRQIRTQFDRMGYSFNWERSFVSSDETLYRWSQWLFLLLLERDLIYRASGKVDWCDGCQTVLASLQVEDGCCWRCGSPVRVDERAQWYLRMTAYVEENDRRLDERASADRLWLGSQRTLLGRLNGHDVTATGARGRLTIFLPAGATLAAGRFVAMSPRHPDIDEWATTPSARAQLGALRGGGWHRADRRPQTMPIIDTGCAVLVEGRALPLVVTPAVDVRYGPTAVLGTSDDRTDVRIAERVDLDAKRELALAVAPATRPRPTVRYRSRDYPISRQRAWGAPIPIVRCDACGLVPVASSDLPVRLPPDIQPTGRGNPLSADPDFLATTCPRCGGPATRETDTLDCHFDASWMFVPVCVPAVRRADAMFDDPELRRWLPGKRVMWGADGGASILDQRFMAKALRDAGKLGWLTDGEPFQAALMHEMVQLDGRKMSKHLHNVVDPDALVARVGADAIRLAAVVAAAPHHPLTWTEQAVQRSSAFLEQLWDFAHVRLSARPQPPDDAAIHAADPLRRRLARWCDAAVRRVTEDFEALSMHRAAENTIQLLARIQTFELRAQQRRGVLDEADRAAVVVALRLLLRLLAPIAPHIVDELWDTGGCEGLAVQQPWPTLAAGGRDARPQVLAQAAAEAQA